MVDRGSLEQATGRDWLTVDQVGSTPPLAAAVVDRAVDGVDDGPPVTQIAGVSLCRRAAQSLEPRRGGQRDRVRIDRGIVSRSPAVLDRARRELEVGNLYLNRGLGRTSSVWRVPVFGDRVEGGGADYLGQFVVPVHVTENTLRQGFAVDEEGGEESDE